MNKVKNMKLLGTDNAKEENNSNTIKATVGLYQLDGDVVNWTTENDLIYVIIIKTETYKHRNIFFIWFHFE